MFDALSSGSTSLTWLVIDAFVKLGAVLVLIYACLYIFRRLKFGSSGLARKQLNILEILHLSPRQKLYLVRAGTKVLLIGATDQHLSTLSEVEMREVPPDAETVTPANELTASGQPAIAGLSMQSLSLKDLSSRLLPWLSWFSKADKTSRQEASILKSPAMEP